MNARYYLTALSITFLACMPTTGYGAQSLAQRLSGSILLQVEQNGEAWYVNPLNHERYYLPNGDSAYSLMRSLGQGISDNNLARIPEPETLEDLKNPRRSSCRIGSLGLRFRGQILLQVEQNGEAWYVSPDTCKRVYLRDGEAAYNMMRGLGKGIKDGDLDKIEIHPSISLQTDEDALDQEMAPPPATSSLDVALQQLQNDAFLKYRQGRHQEALLDYQNIVSLKSNDIFALTMISHLKSLLGDYRGAIIQANEVLRLSDGNFFVYYTRGYSKSKLGDERGAVEDYSQGIQMNPDFDNLYYVRGLSHLILDHEEQGCRDLSKAGELGIERAYQLIRTYCN